MHVAEFVGHRLASGGVTRVFGVVGSGNFRMTDALVSRGAHFTPARHESGAVMMAAAHTLITSAPAVASVHQGPGLTNALTAIIESAKSRTPMIVLTAAVLDQRSNFWIDQEALFRSLGIAVVHLENARDAGVAVGEALRLTAAGQLVVLNVPVELQLEEAGEEDPIPAAQGVAAPAEPGDIELLEQALARSTKPVFLVGRGGVSEGERIAQLAERAGALLVTTAPARGLFAGDAWSLDVAGGFSSPGSWELLLESDLLVVWGASLNRWTTRDGALLGGREVIQIDSSVRAAGAHYPVDHAVVASVSCVLDVLQSGLTVTRNAPGLRTEAVRQRIEASVPWASHAFEDTSDGERIDPRALTIALNALIRPERTLVTDGGNFNGYPAMFFDVPDVRAMCLPLWFQSIGLGLGAAVGAAIARPDRTVVLGIGDGGFMMSHVELDIAVREHLDIVLVVYNDDAYGAEVHHFGPMGFETRTVEFPQTDVARVAAGHGCRAITVKRPEELAQLGDLLASGGHGPVVVDARITQFPSWVLEHTFTAE